MASTELFRKAKERRSFTVGQTIFKEGEPGDVMYVVEEGEVDILRSGRPIETIAPGGIFGEMAIIDNSPRSATAVAKSDCTLLPVDETTFTIYVQHAPFFALEVMRTMAERLRRRLESAS
jgi:CRP-like cAMP-binding protein